MTPHTHNSGCLGTYPDCGEKTPTLPPMHAIPGLTVYPCGCKAVYGETLRLVYCPTHAAAPEMRRYIQARADESCEACVDGDPCMHRDARALLARLEGG